MLFECPSDVTLRIQLTQHNQYLKPILKYTHQPPDHSDSTMHALHKDHRPVIYFIETAQTETKPACFAVQKLTSRRGNDDQETRPEINR